MTHELDDDGSLHYRGFHIFPADEGGDLSEGFMVMGLDAAGKCLIGHANTVAEATAAVDEHHGAAA